MESSKCYINNDSGFKTVLLKSATPRESEMEENAGRNRGDLCCTFLNTERFVFVLLLDGNVNAYSVPALSSFGF